MKGWKAMSQVAAKTYTAQRAAEFEMEMTKLQMHHQLPDDEMNMIRHAARQYSRGLFTLAEVVWEINVLLRSSNAQATVNTLPHRLDDLRIEKGRF